MRLAGVAARLSWLRSMSDGVKLQVELDVPVRRAIRLTTATVTGTVTRHGPGFRLGTGRDSDCLPDKPMLLISSSHEKQMAIKPRSSRHREFYVNESQRGSEYLRHRSGAEHFSSW